MNPSRRRSSSDTLRSSTSWGADTGVAAQRLFRRCLGGWFVPRVVGCEFLFLSRFGQTLVGRLGGGEGFVGKFRQAFEFGVTVRLGGKGESLLLQTGQELLRPGTAGGGFCSASSSWTRFCSSGHLGLELPVFLFQVGNTGRVGLLLHRFFLGRV